MDTKPIWRSKTFWFNVAFIVITLGGAALRHLGYTDFQPSSEVVEVAGVLLAIVNIILRRYFTRTAVK